MSSSAPPGTSRSSGSSFTPPKSSLTDTSPGINQTFSENGGQPIVDHMLGDQPAATKEQDKLGFGTYVSAVQKFLTDSSTEIPLTLSVEGLWGSGKSSFMLQLQEALRNRGKKKIVAFNAWQYNADDGLWAAFIHEFDQELHKQLTWPERLLARWKLLKLRTKWQGWIDTLVALVWFLASFTALVAITFYLFHGGLAQFRYLVIKSGKVDESANEMLTVIGGLGGTVVTLLIFLRQTKGLLKSPASFDRAVRLFRGRDYDDRLPLIHQVTRDFNSLVKAYAGKEDVYVFIDDLDRCEYSKAAELMQALLMLLSSAPKIALIVGLDRDKVAAAMAAKQEKLIPYLYRIEPGQAYKRGMDYGQRFIEKFIQISFILPVPRASGLKAMVNPEAATVDQPVPESQKSERIINIVTGKDDSATLDSMIDMADQVLDHNPRNVKQFVNLFRLQAFIANETGLFGTERSVTKSGSPITIPQLGKFVILSMRWPEFVADAARDPELVRNLESTTTPGSFGTTPAAGTLPAAPLNIASSPSVERTNFWMSDPGLMNLVLFGVPTGNQTLHDFSLADLDFRRLNEIAPPRPKSDGDMSQEFDDNQRQALRHPTPIEATVRVDAQHQR